MPHDQRGNELKVGDQVLIRATVLELMTGEDFCNVRIEPVHRRRPDNKVETLDWLNTAILEKVE